MQTSNTINLSANQTPLATDVRVIGLVGAGHMISHFSQLLLAPLFPLLKVAFNVSYAELGFLMMIFFGVSCGVQALSGFAVDKFGPRPILFAGLTLLGTAAFGYAASTSYAMLAVFAVIAGVGNGVFHPVNYTLLNRKISGTRLGHAYSVHGITGSLGWALAPAMLVPLSYLYSWRVALAAAGVLTFSVLALLLVNRDKLALEMPKSKKPLTPGLLPTKGEGSFEFLKIPAVWMCFAFFFWYAMSLSIVQAFAPEAARQLHQGPFSLVAICLTTYMLASAGGMLLGGFMASDPARCTRIVGVGFGVAASSSILLAVGSFGAVWVPILFGVMGFASGIAAPSRDLLVKRSTPDNASGRVYGVVYAGLDIGQALSPLIFGALMDHGQYRGILMGLAALQAVLIVSAFNVQRFRRPALVMA